jgi:acyl CoA:acetate/3-ketoacid CoA transferase alpha subunit
MILIARTISITGSSMLLRRTAVNARRVATPFAKCMVSRYSANVVGGQVRYYTNSSADSYFATKWGLDGLAHDVGDGVDGPKHDGALKYDIPQRVRQKLISASDAVALVRDGDTVCVSGFVTQGAAEAVLKALGKRFENTQSPKNLTILFGGGPGDYGERGLSHLAKIADDGTRMLKRTIGGHYGQVPKVAELVLQEKVEAWTLPMGSVSRMIRAQSTHSPGHITTIGIGTYVDPDHNGGAANESAKKSKLHRRLVSKLVIDDKTYLSYKALPINVGTFFAFHVNFLILNCVVHVRG